VLSAAGPPPGGHHDHRISSDFVDEGSGRQAPGARARGTTGQQRANASAEGRPKQNEIADTETKLNIGDQVSLPRYGSGRVAEIGDDALVVSFPDGKNRKFKREFARPISRSRQKM
jgi:hypothetical protein